MEKMPNFNNNERRDGFVVGESGEAVPAQFHSKSSERIKKIVENLEEQTGRKSLTKKPVSTRVDREYARRLPEDVFLKPNENIDDLKIKIGDLVQWKNANADQWESPRKIKGFSPDRQFAFFEESTTGIPTKELHIWDQKE